MHDGYEIDENNIRWSIHFCDTCNQEFKVAPAVEPETKGYEDCLDWECDSYDASRDFGLQMIASNNKI